MWRSFATGMGHHAGSNGTVLTEISPEIAYLSSLAPIMSSFAKTAINKPELPPAPLTISTLSFLYNYPSFHGLLCHAAALLRSGRHSAIFTIHIGSTPFVFIADSNLAHQALIRHGSAASDRPTTGPATKVDSIAGAPYGSTWSTLRRNLTPHFINPSNLADFSSTRKWALELLIKTLRAHSDVATPVHVIDHFFFSMFSLQITMCFGSQITDEETVRSIMDVNRRLFQEGHRFRILGYYPKITKILFRNRWKILQELQSRKEETLIPLIRSRKAIKEKNDGALSHCYLDGLMDLRLPEGRALTESENMELCSSFLVASTDLRVNTLQWIMAELVRNPRVQAKLLAEMKEVVGDRALPEGLLEEEEMKKVGYLKAVVLEGMRLHPPGHLLIPHRVAEETEVGGYVVPRGAVLNVMVAEIGRDSRVWEDPAEFRPERFKEGGGVDLTGRGGVKMMPSGVGRRICPGRELALLNLEWFVGNLVWNFEWEAAAGEVDMSEKEEFVMAMKSPLQARLRYRFMDNQNKFENWGAWLGITSLRTSNKIGTIHRISLEM